MRPMRRRRLLALVCLCSAAVVAIGGAGLGVAVVRGAHAAARRGAPSRGNTASSVSNVSNPACYRWAAYPGPAQGTGNNELGAVAVVPNSPQVWAVGDYFDASSGNWLTLIERFDGAHWSIVPSPNVASASNYLYGVTAVSASEAWAVGYSAGSVASGTQTLVEKWNGTSWSIVASQNMAQTSNYLYAVTAVSANDVWVVGDYFDNATIRDHTLIEHWNGSAWGIVASPNGSAPGPKSGLPGSNVLTGVAAISANDIWAVGYDTSITLAEHWNGSSWSIVPTPNGTDGDGNLQSVAALSSNNVMAVGSTGYTTFAAQWNGSNWNIVASPNPTTTNNNWLSSISVVPGTTSYIAAGTAVAQGGIATRGGMQSLSRNGPYSGIATGKTLAESWNGTSWSMLTTPNLGYYDGLNGVAASSASSVWAVGAYPAATANGTLILRSVPNGMGVACTQ